MEGDPRNQRPDPEDARRTGVPPRGRSIARAALMASVALALFGLLAAAIAGSPYLSLSEPNLPFTLYIVGLFVALYAMPVALGAGVAGTSGRRNEGATVAWGAAGLVVTVGGLLLGAAGGFSGDSLAGSVGLVAAVEGGLVTATVGVTVLGG